jgi:hypothetical protein
MIREIFQLQQAVTLMGASLRSVVAFLPAGQSLQPTPGNLARGRSPGIRPMPVHLRKSLRIY